MIKRFSEKGEQRNAIPAPSRPCRRFVRLSQPSRARTHPAAENQTLRRRAGVLQEWQAQKKDVCERISAEGEAASGEAGQSRGVVRAPRRSHLPAVRAVSGICEGVVERAKIALVGSQFEKSPPFQGKRRGCTKKVHGKRKKQQVQRWVKQLRVYREKQRAGPKTCTLPSEKSMLYCTRNPARIRLTIICQKSCSSALQYRLSGIS